MILSLKNKTISYNIINNKVKGKMIAEKNILYTIPVNLEREVEEEVEKKSKRKNKDTGKMEVVTSTEKVKVKKEILYTIYIKKPNRTELEEGDMFYSVELNKYIKMGLLTKAMLAKQYGNQGGIWSEEEQKMYADLVYKMHSKQLEIQEFSLLSDGGKISDRQSGKLDKAVRELSEIKKQLTEYEMLQNSLFDHTADVKARNRAIMWYILHMTYFKEGEGDSPLEEMFEGTTFEERYNSYEDKDENDDELYIKCIDKISSILTIWYISGAQQRSGIEEILKEMKKFNEDSEEDSEEEDSEELAEANA